MEDFIIPYLKIGDSKYNFKRNATTDEAIYCWWIRTPYDSYTCNIIQDKKNVAVEIYNQNIFRFKDYTIAKFNINKINNNFISSEVDWNPSNIVSNLHYILNIDDNVSLSANDFTLELDIDNIKMQYIPDLFKIEKTDNGNITLLHIQATILSVPIPLISLGYSKIKFNLYVKIPLNIINIKLGYQQINAYECKKFVWNPIYFGLGIAFGRKFFPNKTKLEEYKSNLILQSNKTFISYIFNFFNKEIYYPEYKSKLLENIDNEIIDILDILVQRSNL